MKNNTKQLFCLLFICMLHLNLFAQKQFSEGVITYKMSMTGPQATDPQAMGMMENMKMMQSIKGDKSRTDIDMGIMNQSIINDGKTKGGTILMDWGGQKMSVNMTEKDIKAQDAKKPKYEVEYTNETKDICGYKCKKAIVKMEKGEKCIVYYTKDLTMKYKDFDASQYEKIDGVPLEWEQVHDNTMYKYTVTKIENKKIDDSIFTVSPDYKPMTMEEFGKMMGGFSPQ